MMVLVDAGNTRIKVDCIDTQTGWRTGAVQAFAMDELKAMREWRRTWSQRPQRGLGVNVAGDRVAATIESLLDCPVDWIAASGMALGVRNEYREPARLGADRWAALLGLAWHARRSVEHHASTPLPPAVLAIFGTATTIDTLIPDSTSLRSQDPSWLQFTFPGGLIVPGPAMMLASLNSGTANLPRARSDTAPFPIHTHQAIVSGMAAAQAGAVMRQWLVAFDSTGHPPQLYVAGGGWPLVKDEMHRLIGQMGHRLNVSVALPLELDAPVLDGLACLAGQQLVWP